MIHGPFSVLMAGLVMADAGGEWSGLGSLLLAAFLGALLALVLQRLFQRRLERGATSTRAEQGLREFAHEVEERLDVKLDRLEQLVRETRSVMDSSGGSGASSRPVSVRKDPEESGGEAHGDPLGTVTHGTVTLGTVSKADRDRVLELAALGTVPEQIAESVGLLGGEVDLILRLHRSAERVQEG